MPTVVSTGPSTGIIPVEGLTPIRVFGTKPIRDHFDATCLEQAVNARRSPGVRDLVLNPDAHAGYGAPVGCVMTSPDHVYPGPVGVDIKCSMSFLQTDIPADAIIDRPTRRALIDALCERLPTGAGRGARSVKKGRNIDIDLGELIVGSGATTAACEALGIPPEWTMSCEDWQHEGASGLPEEAAARLVADMGTAKFHEKVRQLGSYGGGNHFGECCIVEVADGGDPMKGLAASTVADAFGLRDGHVGFLSHCGSRGLGWGLADRQFKKLKRHFETWSIAFPGHDPELCYAPLGTPEADAYLDDMAMGGNFATMNHMLINALVLEAFQQVIPGCTGRLVYYISHNFARWEIIHDERVLVHRKGATRAYPAGHHALRGTPFAAVGHPILLPGNAADGSVIMAARDGAERSCFSVNHGAGRCMGRKAAMRELKQADVERLLAERDVLSNCRTFPIDEAPAAYKDFAEVVKSVELAELAFTVARLRPRFVVKDGDTSLKGAA